MPGAEPLCRAVMRALRSRCSGEVVQEDVLQLLGTERQPGDLGVALHVDQVLRAQQQGELAEVHLRAPAPARSARSTSPRLAGHRVEVAQVRLARPCGPSAADAPGARRRSARRSSPSRARAARRRPSGRRPRRPAPRCRRSWPRAAGSCGRGCRGRRRSSRGRRPSPGRRCGAPAPACPGSPTAGPGCRRRAGRARTRGPVRRVRLGREAAGRAAAASSTSGTRHGSEPLASEPSDSRITGVR